MKVKKVVALIMTLFIMDMAYPTLNVTSEKFTSFASYEYTEGTYDRLTYKNYGDYIEISDCYKSVETIEIPSYINGIPVTSIGENAFYECRDLTSVNIPESVKNIGSFAFTYCKSLKSVNIPDGVTSIEYDTFAFCSSLISIELPESVTFIDDYAFYSCKNLVSLNIPESVTKIGGFAFYKTLWFEEKRKENPFVVINGILIDGEMCSGEILIPDGVKSIGYSAFAGCENLVSVVVPRCVETIEYGAFKACPELESITFLNPECDIFADEYTVSNNFDYFYGTIYGYENSTTQMYAGKYHKNFISLGQAPEEVSTLAGDINGDGKFNVADTVLFQKYLLGISDTEIVNPNNVDLYSDRRLDAFDLCLMKRKLTEDFI